MPPVDNKIRKFAEEVLRATNPSGANATDPVDRLILGFLKDARRMLKALLVLGGSDLDDAGDGLARSIFEHAVTAGWVIAEPARYDKVLAAYQSDWDDIQTRWERENPNGRFPFGGDDPIVLLTEGGHVRLPKIETRARAAGLKEYMILYKGLCLSVHGTLLAASFALSGAEPRKRLRRMRFGLSGTMVLKLAELLSSRLGLGWELRLARIQRKWEDYVIAGEVSQP